MASSGSNMQGITINGIRVQFPCRPYPSQISMMDKILKGLERRQNCLLESPTGSGKSLALLCSALAWQQTEHLKLKQEEEQKSERCAHCSGYSTSEYFLQTAQKEIDLNSLLNKNTDSRTTCSEDDDDDFKLDARKLRGNGGVRPHVDISYEEEFKTDLETTAGGACTCHCGEETPAKKPKVPKIWFGTRTHKQIAQIARELGKTAYKNVRMCILASREHTCIDPEVSSMSHKNEECKNKLDGPGCRFFDRVRKISQKNIQTHGLSEAWDLEDFVGFCKKHSTCPYFGARQLKDGADIIFSPYNYLVDPGIRESMDINLKDQIVILDEAHNIEDSARESASFTFSTNQLEDAIKDLQSMIEEGVKPGEHSAIQKFCQRLIELIEKNENTFNANDFNETSKVWNGIDMVAMLENMGCSPQNFGDLQKCLAAITEEEIDETGGMQRGKLPTILPATAQLLKGLFMTLHFLFKDNLRFMEDYRVALVKTMVQEKLPTNGRWLNKKRKGHVRASWTMTMNFWSMNPAVAFSEIEDARTIILTSGTLSPMNSFQSELGVPFPISLEANHVIGSSQVWIGTIGRGPKGNPLLANYQNSESFGFQDEVGNLVLQVCKTIPHGVLCFLPSYKMLDKLTNRWKTTGLWEELEQTKELMQEPRASDKVDFDELIKNFYEVIEQTAENDLESGEQTGALFFAVCRGKVSEGLDFADNNARAVITVGIPFPNVKDTQVELKKQYNNMYCNKRGLLGGSEWYEIQAYRALNQALGRCIRHRCDWGALILVDERYSKNPSRYIKGLSKWVRQKVKHYPNFMQMEESLRDFTARRQQITEDLSMSMAAPATQMSPGTTQASQHPDAVTPKTPSVQDASHLLQIGCSSALSQPQNSHAVVKTSATLNQFSISQAGGFLPASQIEPTQTNSTQQVGPSTPKLTPQTQQQVVLPTSKTQLFFSPTGQLMKARGPAAGPAVAGHTQPAIPRPIAPTQQLIPVTPTDQPDKIMYLMLPPNSTPVVLNNRLAYVTHPLPKVNTANREKATTGKPCQSVKEVSTGKRNPSGEAACATVTSKRQRVDSGQAGSTAGIPNGKQESSSRLAVQDSCPLAAQHAGLPEAESNRAESPSLFDSSPPMELETEPISETVETCNHSEKEFTDKVGHRSTTAQTGKKPLFKCAKVSKADEHVICNEDISNVCNNETRTPGHIQEKSHKLNLSKLRRKSNIDVLEQRKDSDGKHVENSNTEHSLSSKLSTSERLKAFEFNKMHTGESGQQHLVADVDLKKENEAMDDKEVWDPELSTRRSRRRISKGRKKKGIQYVDSDEEEIGHAELPKKLVCERCGQLLASCLTDQRPLKEVLPGCDDLRADFSGIAAMKRTKTMYNTSSAMVKEIQHQHQGIPLNCYMDKQSCTVIQFVTCEGCYNKPDCPVIGFQVLVVGSNQKLLEVGQYWLQGAPFS